MRLDVYAFLRRSRALILGLGVVALLCAMPSANNNGNHGTGNSSGNSSGNGSGGGPHTGFFPQVTCVRPDPYNYGFYLAQFGYENDDTDRHDDGKRREVPIGKKNNFKVNGDDRSDEVGLPTRFKPGIHENSFTVRFAPNAMEVPIWRLNGVEAAATLSSPSCGQ